MKLQVDTPFTRLFIAVLLSGLPLAVYCDGNPYHLLPDGITYVWNWNDKERWLLGCYDPNDPYYDMPAGDWDHVKNAKFFVYKCRSTALGEDLTCYINLGKGMNNENPINFHWSALWKCEAKDGGNGRNRRLLAQIYNAYTPSCATKGSALYTN